MRIVSRNDRHRSLGNFAINYGGENMVDKRKHTLFVAMVALCMLSLSFGEAAWAHGDRGGAERKGLPGGILQELIFPCQAECRNSARDCVEAAEDEGIGCIQSACATQIQSAKTACATDQTAQACKDAVSALRTCGDSCITTFQTGATACRTTEQSCRSACDLTP